MIRLALLILLLISGNCLSQTDSLTLVECIQMTLAGNPLLKSRLASMEASKISCQTTKKGSGYRTDFVFGTNFNNNHQVRSGSLNLNQLLPWGGNFSAFTSLDQTGFDPYLIGNSELTNMSYGFSFQQIIFSDNSQKLFEKSASLQLSVQEQSLQNTKKNLIFQTTEAFYNVIQASKVLEVRKEALELSKILTGLVQKRFEEGVFLNVDLLESQVLRALAEVNLEQAQLALETERTNLQQLVGTRLDEQTVIEDDMLIKPVIFPDEATINTAIAMQPGIRNYEIQSEQNEITKKYIRKSFDFNIALTGNYQKNASEYSLRGTIDKFNEDWSLGINVNVPLWDSHITKKNLESIDYQDQNITFLKENQTNELRTRIKIEENNLLRLSKTISLLKKEEEISLKNLDLMNMKFLGGLNLAEDVIRAQQNLTNARLRLVSEKINYQMALARLFLYTDLDIFAPEGLAK